MYFHLFDAIIAWLTKCTEITIGRVTVHIILCKFCFYQKKFGEEKRNWQKKKYTLGTLVRKKEKQKEHKYR